MARVADFGSWTSPITPESFSQGNLKAICELQATKAGVYWVEQSLTGARELYFQGRDETTKTRWAEGYSVQTRVHEYGGGSFVVAKDGSVYFSTADGIYHQKTAADPVVEIVNEGRHSRFADFTLTEKEICCVSELHDPQHEHAEPNNRLVAIDRQTKKIRTIAYGHNFYACPRVSPDGKKIAWMQWMHNNMPWDETTIMMADVGNMTDTKSWITAKSGVNKNINCYNPMWSPENELFYISDDTNFWNLYKYDQKHSREENVYPVEEEIGYPMWQFGDRPCAFGKERIVMKVGEKLILKEGEKTRELSTPGYSYFSHLSLTDDGFVYLIASGWKRMSSLLKINTNTNEVTVIREGRDAAELDALDVSEPEVLKFSSDGHTIVGFYYPPKNRDFEGPKGALPPVILNGHGGPTGSANRAILDLKKQFFTSRGFAVFDVDYRGSTSYGTKFRNLLKREWGVVDRDDMINGAAFLIESRRADPEKICIMGSSAGGYLLLNVLIHDEKRLFKAAVSIYGVADLIDLVKTSHKFEKGYNKTLIGEFPLEAGRYHERNPIEPANSKKLNVPIAFFHGKEDTVVAYSQSVRLHSLLREKGIPTALQLYDNEGHGFRGPEAVRKSNEGAYYFFCKVLGITPSVSSDLNIDNLQ